MGFYKLDNPVWNALSETHSPIAISYDDAKFYMPGFAPFGGFVGNKNIAAAVVDFIKQSEGFYILGQRPTVGPGVELKSHLVVHQMLIEKTLQSSGEEKIVLLNGQFDKELFELVNMVQPGYFREATGKMGAYFGIFQNNKLVAAAGERMKLNGFTEVSAIVTDPAYTGKGFARQLMLYTMDKIFSENKIPFLHVAENNERAIRLYEWMGFETRKKMDVWHFIKT